MGFFSSSTPARGSAEERVRDIRGAREYHAEAQGGTRADRRHAAAVLNALTGMASPDEVDQGYALPLRPVRER